MDIDSLINKKVKEIVRDAEIASFSIGKYGANAHYKSIDSTVYSQTSEYERTRGLLNSVDYDVHSSDNIITIRIFNNPELMSLYTIHESWVDKSNQNENIVNFLNYGHHGIVDYTPARFIEMTQSEMDKVASVLLKKELKKLGHKVR